MINNFAFPLFFCFTHVDSGRKRYRGDDDYRSSDRSHRDANRDSRPVS